MLEAQAAGWEESSAAADLHTETDKSLCREVSPVFVYGDDDRYIVVNGGQGEDGRQVTFAQRGDLTEGYPIFLLHGSPGSRLGPRQRYIALYRMGVRLITPDRPGYGGSDPLPGRSIVDCATDVEAIADALGIEKFSVMGRSMGGPHALACAAKLPERVERVGVLVSPASPDIGFDWCKGMASSNVEVYDQGVPEVEVIANIRRRVKETQEDPESLLRALEPDLAPADRNIVGDVVMRILLAASYAEAVRQGPEGWVDDVLALRRPWGFSPEEIEAPVHLWHGEADTFSPAEHTRRMAEWLGSTCVEVSIAQGSGHFGAFWESTELLAKMISANGTRY